MIRAGYWGWSSVSFVNNIRSLQQRHAHPLIIARCSAPSIVARLSGARSEVVIGPSNVAYCAGATTADVCNYYLTVWPNNASCNTGECMPVCLLLICLTID